MKTKKKRPLSGALRVPKNRHWSDPGELSRSCNCNQSSKSASPPGQVKVVSAILSTWNYERTT